MDMDMDILTDMPTGTRPSISIDPRLQRMRFRVRIRGSRRRCGRRLRRIRAVLSVTVNVIGIDTTARSLRVRNVMDRIHRELLFSALFLT